MQSLMHRRSRRPAGYTLVELLVVLGVLGVLGYLVVPLAEVTLQRDREHELKHALWEIRDAIDAYKRATEAGSIVVAAGQSGYPPDLITLTQGVPDAKASGRMLYFLRRVPRDPFADPALPAEQTWGLRSYQSPPDHPQPGADVYDVYSRSSRVGLNGQALNTW